MAPNSTYPGVYIEELPSGVRSISGVATSITAFIGRAKRGPVNEPVLVHSLVDYDRGFGGLWADSMMSYSIQHYFQNGGTDAIIVRVQNNAVATNFTLRGDAGILMLEAANAGSWADNLEIEVDYQTQDPSDNTSFNLAIREVVDGTTIAEEVFDDLSTRQDEDRCVERILEQQSEFLRVRGDMPNERPNPGPPEDRTSGSDGEDIGFAQIAEPTLKPSLGGIWALDNADIFNLLCIPPFTIDTDVDAATWTEALIYCREKSAMLIIDPPSSWINPLDVISGDELTGSVPARDQNAAVFYPRVNMASPLKNNQTETFAPCGLIAGLYARTDSKRGVWKAPAGRDATLVGVNELHYSITDAESKELNRMGVNCLRSFPDTGPVVWGSRTTVGADHLASDWKYVSVRRLALFLEQSICRGLLWAVSEPNDERLRSGIRSNVGSFMAKLFRQGALQGLTPSDAYFVKCDRETTSEVDISQGIVNVEVGFAPLRPAEFVVILIRID